MVGRELDDRLATLSPALYGTGHFMARRPRDRTRRGDADLAGCRHGSDFQEAWCAGVVYNAGAAGIRCSWGGGSAAWHFATSLGKRSRSVGALRGHARPSARRSEGGTRDEKGGSARHHRFDNRPALVSNCGSTRTTACSQKPGVARRRRSRDRWISGDPRPVHA
jgi:hypothetical protein